MGTGRRLAVLLLALAVIGTPAAAMRVGCVGASCRSSDGSGEPAPFCSLPADLRALITAGTYEGRSPDALGVAGSTAVKSDVGGGTEVPWPTVGEVAAMTVPVLFIGRGIRTAELVSTLGLDQIAPTLAQSMGLERPHPEVRSGTPIPGVIGSDRITPLTVLIVWKRLGMDDLPNEPTPWFDHASSRPGSTNDPGTGEPGIAGGLATAGSLPLDPTAVETTIGTGGLPSQHGITGTWVRSPRSSLTRAYGPGAPPTVIASLGDDLDRATGGRALIGLIRGTPGDVGLTGDAWYGTGPVRDATVRAGASIPAQVTGFLREGWGADATPDLLAVPIDGGPASADRVTARIVDEVLAAVPDATIVVTATGSLSAPDAVLAAAPPGVVLAPHGDAGGGFFVDRGADVATTAQQVVDAMRAQTAPGGSPLYEDAFASYAVRFGRYC
ncbi:MAG TPA: hypothetical protein VJM84_01805 [Actinomycetota bacterium]|nr:hypothetical protein [Actinomycetota bacterium]